MQFDIQEILQNKTMLYIVLGLALANLIGYMSSGNNDAVMMFFILGVLASYFSKNMIVIMGVPLLLVSLYVVMRRTSQEGLENADDKKEKKAPAQKAPTKGLAKKLNIKMAGGEETNSEKALAIEKDILDTDKTMEASLKNLEQALSGDGIKSLTKDTEQLQQQQERLMGLMEQLLPLINKGQTLMESFEGAGGANLGDKAGSLIDMLQGALGQFVDTGEEGH